MSAGGLVGPDATIIIIIIISSSGYSSGGGNGNSSRNTDGRVRRLGGASPERFKNIRTTDAYSRGVTTRARNRRIRNNYEYYNIRRRPRGLATTYACVCVSLRGIGYVYIYT